MQGDFISSKSEENKRKKRNLDDLINLIKRLRGKDGCPWDRKQTKDNLKIYLIEEAYEVLDAIDDNSPFGLKEELGDLLFQILFLAEISRENGEFDIFEVMAELEEKMIRRHPHVFGNKKVNSVKEVLSNWREIKKKEGKSDEDLPFNKIAKNLPALIRAFKITKEASYVGFDWENWKGALKKVKEEEEEFFQALMEQDREKIENELGDFLFAIVNVSRHIKINPEEALQKAIFRFTKRFLYITDKLKSKKIRIEDAALKEMDDLWEEAKKKRM
jgi:tetrapyrrole methylase family protein/MazG family protein